MYPQGNYPREHMDHAVQARCQTHNDLVHDRREAYEKAGAGEDHASSLHGKCKIHKAVTALNKSLDFNKVVNF